MLSGNVLELGGGDKPQYHPNIDVRAGPGVDIVADLNRTLPVKNGSFDGVYCQYAIEHISWRSLAPFIGEISRVLKMGGQAVIVTANLKEQARVIATRDTWEGEYESRLIFGDQDYSENSHKCGLSPELAARLFNSVGMAVRIEPLPSCTTDMVIYAEKTPKDRFQWVREQIPVGANVVDIGCSDAPVTWNIPNVTYVDSEPYEKLAADVVKLGRTPFPKEKFVQHNADTELPFDDKKFDIVLATEIFEHVENPVELFREVARIARRVVITIPNEYDWDERWKPFQNPSHVRHYTKDRIVRELAAAGYREYVLDRLDYSGWSFWTVLYDSPEERTVRTKKSRKSVTYSISLLSTPFMIVPPTGYGGLERVVYDLAIGLRDLGHDVTVFAPNGSKIDGCRVVFTGNPVSTTKTDWLAEESRVFETVKDAVEGQQIIHGHNWFGLEYRLRTDKTRIIHTHHGGLNTEWWKVPPFPLNLVAISDFMKRVYAGQGHKAEYVYNGIDLEKYGYYDGPRNGRLLFVGRIDKFKQPHVAIEVARAAGLGLDIIGGTFVQDDTYLDEIVKACDGEQIKFWRDPPQPVKVELMQRAKCLVFPSKMNEPFGLVAVESMACGTPVVALRDGAIAEVIEDSVTGFVCDSPDAMVKAVARVDQIEPLAYRARVERLFSRERMAASYVELYQRVIAGREW